MKRALIGIIALLLLVLVLPGTALAAKVPVSAYGVITSISESEEFPAGTSGRIKVVSRTIYGSFTSGDILGSFTMTYKANVELATQAGNLAGTLTTGPHLFYVSGYIQPVQWIPIPGSPDAYTGLLTATGEWALGDPKDDRGSGTFTARIVFVPTPDGHVASILPGSEFTMSGVWKP